MRMPLLVLIAASAAPVASAHHSLSGYNQAREVAFEGTVVEFRFTQPHPILLVQGSAPAAAPALWRLEMDNLGELREVGVARDTFRPGDRVGVRGWPDRGGAAAMYLVRLDRPSDGLRYEQVGFSPRLTRSGR